MFKCSTGPLFTAVIKAHRFQSCPNAWTM